MFTEAQRGGYTHKHTQVVTHTRDVNSKLKMNSHKGPILKIHNRYCVAMADLYLLLIYYEYVHLGSISYIHNKSFVDKMHAHEC